ncbi:MAG: PBP1A family penicillin-binding protein [Alphaproteobacteria bacterium]|nr:PBP1A family penicillin-binding protein [Alphaproteobacteria bacterium]
MHRTFRKNSRAGRREPHFGRGSPPFRPASRPASRPAAAPPAGTRGRRASKRLGRRLLVWGSVAVIWLAIVGAAVIGWFAYTLPDVTTATSTTRRAGITLLASDGSVLATYGEFHGATVDVRHLPRHVGEAVLAIEDRRYFEHGGIDFQGLARAMLVNLFAGEIRQGGSTLTQQLAKNLFLSSERSLRRKIQELLLALWLERNYSKTELLSLYLNRVYLGAGAYGIDAAAERYFEKPAKALGLWEAAVIAGLLKAPSKLAPTHNPEGAIERGLTVLAAMVDAGFIDQATATRARASHAGFAGERNRLGTAGRYFADWVMDQVQGFVGFTDRDLTIATTLDPTLQRAAEAGVAETLARAGAESAAGQGAVVVLAPDGAVRALVGGRDYLASQFNRATQAHRQPGSAFKPFVFLAAMDAGATPDDMVRDQPVAIGNWRPGNFRDRFYGDVTLREALARSLNSVAVQLTQRHGAKAVARAAERLGITSELRPDLSIALGTSEVTLLELTGAYAPFANGGLGVLPHGITRIQDRQGQVLYRRGGQGPGRVIEATAAIRMDDMLRTVIEGGTGRAARLDGRPAGGKTGTSQDFRDAWFVGYTADYVAGVWFGNDDRQPMKNVTGGTLPAKLWHDVMAAAHAGKPARPIPLPAAERNFFAERPTVSHAPAWSGERRHEEGAAPTPARPLPPPSGGQVRAQPTPRPAFQYTFPTGPDGG